MEPSCFSLSSISLDNSLALAINSLGKELSPCSSRKNTAASTIPPRGFPLLSSELKPPGVNNAKPVWSTGVFGDHFNTQSPVWIRSFLLTKSTSQLEVNFLRLDIFIFSPPRQKPFFVPEVLQFSFPIHLCRIDDFLYY